MAVIPSHGRQKQWEDQDHIQLHTKFLTGLGYRRPCFKINKTLWLLNFMFFSSKAINKTWFWGVGPLLFCTIFLDLFSLYLKHILSCVYSVLACVFVCWHMWESVCMHMYMSMCVRVWSTEVVIRCLLSLNTQLASVVILASKLTPQIPSLSLKC